MWTRLSGSPLRLAGLFVFVALMAIGFLPLFGGPGYEHALASGVVVPAAAAIATALATSARPLAPFACVLRGLRSGAVLGALALATALLHGLWGGICDLWGGVSFFLLTAGFGGLLGGVWGAAAGEIARARRRRRLVCVAAALAAPIAGILVSAARFYSSPMIFAFDPFFGFFSGTLYDTIVDETAALLTYRAGSAATIAGALLVASALGRTERGGLRFASGASGMADGNVAPGGARAPATLRALLGAGAFAVSLTLAAFGPSLGHYQTAGTIARALGASVSGARCDVVYPDSVVPDQAQLLLRDCEEELAADERRLGTHLDGRLAEFVFRDANEKRALMGAAQTSIAKPWRREVYVQLAAYPHPILGHEVAHVVAGSFGRGPFRIAGAAGGLWPNPGLIEGIAVATSPDDDELTDAQWARAMLDLGILPQAARLFSLDFLGENAAKSYTVAGAFVAWVIDRWGAAAVRAWYGGGDITALTGSGWPELDDAFRASLRALAMPDGASAYAAARFQRPSVWARRCPHVVDRLDRDADLCRDDHRFARAVALYDRALARDPRDWHATLERARVQTGYGDNAAGRRSLAELAGNELAPRTVRDRAEEALADDDLARGRDALAAAAYRRLAERALDEDVRRTLEVKADTSEDALARAAILELLVGSPGRPIDRWVAGLSLGDWAAATRAPVAEYLAGKNLAGHERHARAAYWLDAALAAGDAGAPLRPSVARELVRQRVVCACALDDRAALDGAIARISAPNSPFLRSRGAGRKEWILALAARCAR